MPSAALMVRNAIVRNAYPFGLITPSEVYPVRTFPVRQPGLGPTGPNTKKEMPYQRTELKEAADQLTGSEAGLIVAGEPTIEKALDNAITGAASVVKQNFDASTDEITSELREALKG